MVWHVDLYRIERAAELVELGLDDVIGDRRGICVVEQIAHTLIGGALGIGSHGDDRATRFGESLFQHRLD